MHRASARSLARTLLAAALAATGAPRANGRFPSSNYVVAGPGAAARVVALRTTFGLVLSGDGGLTWAWVCENALDAVGVFDPSLAVAADGAVVVGTRRGMTRSGAGCAWAPPRGDPSRGIADVTGDAAGRFMVAVAGPSGADDTLLLSDDGGASWRAGAVMPGLLTETVEVAPSRAARIYVSGTLGGAAVLLRSDDGGRTTREVTRDFHGGMGAFVSGVDPTNPDVVYVRSNVGIGTMLLRSDDGGVTFRELARTTYDMLGFALSDDGRTVWVASPERAEGIRRSVGGGPFARVAATVSTRCLRYHAGVLYVCADEGDDGYLLGCSTDGGDRIDPLLSARALAGPSSTCAPDSPVATLCGPLWPSQADRLRMIDAGPLPTPFRHDASTPADVTADVADAVDYDAADVVLDASIDVATGARDADAPRDVTRDEGVASSDRGGAGPAPDCGCRAGVGASDRWSLAGLVALVMAGRRRRRA